MILLISVVIFEKLENTIDLHIKEKLILSGYSLSLKRISPFKCKFLTIKMLEDDSEHPIINLQPELNHLFVQCQ